MKPSLPVHGQGFTFEQDTKHIAYYRDSLTDHLYIWNPQIERWEREAQ